ncbi:MAG: molybdopterin-dependent oxidoreductase [Chloroflexi bacterium]|nr:molybdopterin-dependent oxidoreductase [Chloroflexota bacterium]
MRVSRRDFLRLASFSTLGAVACNVFDEREFIAQSPVRLPEDLVTGRDNWYATLCRHCPETEGLVVRVMEGRAKKVQGNPLYPTNLGGHSVRCEAGLQALYHPDRIAGPLTREGPRGSGLYRSIGWDEALDNLRGQLDRSDRSAVLTVTEPLRGSLAHLVSSFTSAYGGRHMAFQPMEEATYARVVRDVLGQETMPTFDIKNTQFLLSFGADFLSTWTAPVQFSKGYGEFRQGQGRERGTFVQVDSRFSMTAANADDWIPIEPGMEGKLALSIAQVIISEELVNEAVIRAMTGGQGASALDAFAPNRIAQQLGIPPLRGRGPAEVIVELARDFARHGSHSLAIGGGSAAAHTNGLFNLSAIYALNFLVGSVGTEGGIKFNPPPPISELATTLPPATTAEWRRLKGEIDNGSIKLLLFRGVNPVHGLPADIDLRDALDSDDVFTVSFSSFHNETTEMADLILPDRAFLEDWGDDIPQPGPGFEIVGMQQPVVNPLPGMSPLSFADILLRMAHELNIDSAAPLDKVTFQDVLKDHARKLHQLDRGSVREATFEAFWNRLLQQGGWWDEGAVATASLPPSPNLVDIANQAQDPRITGSRDPNTFYLVPFQSISLTDGRGAHLPWLQSTNDPITTVTWTTWVEINTAVAEVIGLKEGDFVKVEGPNGKSLTAQIYHHPAVPPEVISIPVGQGHTSDIRYSKDRGQNTLSILGLPLDEETQALAWASTRVRITKTGEREPIPKFEGIVPAFRPNEEDAIVKVTRG